MAINGFFGEYRWLSNFSPVEIMFDSMIFPSVENAYQAAKCRHKTDRFKFLSVPSGVAKKLGNQVDIVDDWDNKKLNIMNCFLYQKFTIDPYQTLLIETNNQPIIELNHWSDRYWGVCSKTNKGDNNLGILIMNIRKELLLPL